MFGKTFIADSQRNELCQTWVKKFAKQSKNDYWSGGGFAERKREFTNQQISLREREMIYFTSDGYIDQHNVERKRFSTHKFKELLQQIQLLDISEQEQVIIQSLKEHQQNEEQRDDISVVGIKL